MLNVTDARAAGRELRNRFPRAAQATLDLVPRDPVEILIDQHRSRLEELIPVRIGRMLQSPFAYYRGTAAVMAHDLATSACTGIRVVACGDAHISNFGLFASPERRMLFDLNDFDEGGVAPWEWDVKRLVASVYVGGRDIGLSESDCEDAAVAAARAYRERLALLFELSALERLFFQVEADMLEPLLSGAGRDLLSRTATKARRRTSERALAKLATTTEDGRTRIVEQPPISRHVEHATVEQLNELFDQYRRTVREDVATLLAQFTLVDYVLRVVGVGSVGTRCYIVLFEGPGGEPLILQVKEAGPSVLQTYGGIADAIPALVGDRYTESRRVVAAQRILQAQSDPFLGWIIGWAGDVPERPRTDFYWRQFRDMKGSVELHGLTSELFTGYGTLCASLLARAHSQSPGAATIRGYLGRSERFDAALGRWARAYADVCEADFAALEAAVAAGRLPAERGV